jgi:hypothetical protein
MQGPHGVVDGEEDDEDDDNDDDGLNENEEDYRGGGGMSWSRCKTNTQQKKGPPASRAAVSLKHHLGIFWGCEGCLRLYAAFLLSRFLFVSFHFLVVYWNPSGASLLTDWLTNCVPTSVRDYVHFTFAFT